MSQGYSAEEHAAAVSFLLHPMAKLTEQWAAVSPLPPTSPVRANTSTTPNKATTPTQ